MAGWRENPIVAAAAIVVIVGALGFVGYRFYGGTEGPKEGESPEGKMLFKCIGCKYEFTHSVREGEVADFQMRLGGIKCPKCGEAKASPAMKCSMCGTVYVLGEAFRSPEGELWCPSCKKAPPTPPIPKPEQQP